MKTFRVYLKEISCYLSRSNDFNIFLALSNLENFFIKIKKENSFENLFYKKIELCEETKDYSSFFKDVKIVLIDLESDFALYKETSNPKEKEILKVNFLYALSDKIYFLFLNKYFKYGSRKKIALISAFFTIYVIQRFLDPSDFINN